MLNKLFKKLGKMKCKFKSSCCNSSVEIEVDPIKEIVNTDVVHIPANQIINNKPLDDYMT